MIVFLVALLAVAAADGAAQNPTPPADPPAATDNPQTTSPAQQTAMSAVGLDDRLWLAQRLPNKPGSSPANLTVVRMREVRVGAPWNEVTRVSGNITTMAARGQELIVSLDNHQWKIVSPSRFLSGAPVPGSGPIRAMAVSSRGIWAVRDVIGGLDALEPKTPADTTANSQPPASAPTTQPNVPILFSLDGNAWTALGSLPPVPDGLVPEISLLSIASDLYLAWPKSDRHIEVIRWVDGKWEPFDRVEVSAAIAEFKLLSVSNRPILWASGDTGGGWLFYLPADQRRVVALELPAEHAQVNNRAVAATGDQVRLFFEADGKVLEQTFNFSDASGQPIGAARELQAPQAQVNTETYQNVLNIILMLILAWFLLSTMRRRQQPEDPEDSN